MLAGKTISVFVPPRVPRDLLFLEIRTGPTLGVAGLLDQGLESLVGGRITPELELVEIQGGGKILDLQARRVGLALLRYFMTLGPTMLPKSPRITSTTNSSISVKPRWRRFVSLSILIHRSPSICPG